MSTTSFLGDLLGTLLERRPFGRKDWQGKDIERNCAALLSERAEISKLALAAGILGQFHELDNDRKAAFFEHLNDDLDMDAELVANLARAYAADRSPGNYSALQRAREPARQRLFRRLNEAPGATAEIVGMRENLLSLLGERPHLAKIDHDLLYLLGSWFNRGFLVMRQITWDSPATILEKIIAYEAVHEIRRWDDLRRRLHPPDRRCFAFFHPAMPSEPLIFVEVALTKGAPSAIQALLAEERETIGDTDADTAAFYSISNCQAGLAGVSFGNSLIGQVARDLARDLPNLKTFVTLSPLPRMAAWMAREGIEPDPSDDARMERLAASYLLNAKDGAGLPSDPVARFHLGNGAMVHAVHAGADPSERGLSASAGVMVNYLYELPRLSERATRFSKRGDVPASPSVAALARRA